MHVVLGKPLKSYRMMAAVWVSGTVRTERQGSAMGTSDYKMQAVAVERYVAHPNADHPPTEPLE